MIEIKIGSLGEFLLYRDGVCVWVVDKDVDLGKKVRELITGRPTE